MADNEQSNAADQTPIDKFGMGATSLWTTLTAIPGKVAAIPANATGLLSRPLSAIARRLPAQGFLRGVGGVTGGVIGAASKVVRIGSGWAVTAASVGDVIAGWIDNGTKGAAVALGDAFPMVAATIGGAKLGAAAGAGIGTLILPGAGTVVGGVVGGMLGGGGAAWATHKFILPVVHGVEKDYGLSLDKPSRTSWALIGPALDYVGNKLKPHISPWIANRIPTFTSSADAATAGGDKPAGADGTAKPDGQTTAAAAPTDFVPMKSMRELEDLDGVPGLKVMVNRQSQEKGNYDIGNGAGTKYMAVFKQVHPDAAHMGSDGHATQECWVEIGRVPDPVDGRARAQAAADIAARDGIPAYANAAQQANPQQPPATGAAPAVPPPPQGADDESLRQANIAAVRARWGNEAGTKVGEFAARADLVNLPNGQVNDVMYHVRQGGLFEKDKIDFYTPADPANPYLMKRSLSLPTAEGQQMIRDLSANPTQAIAIVREAAEQQQHTSAPPVSPPATTLASLRVVQAAAPVPETPQNIISGTGGMFGYSEREGGKVSLFRKTEDGNWFNYTNSATKSDMPDVEAGLRRMAKQFQGDAGTATPATGNPQDKIAALKIAPRMQPTGSLAGGG